MLYSFKRIFKVHSPTAGGFYSVLVGGHGVPQEAGHLHARQGRRVVNPKANTITFNLTRPDAEWLDKIAVPHASILPYGTPNKDIGTKLIPGTGAYKFTKYDPNHQLVLERNPNFKQWSAKAQPDGYPDKITYSFGLTGGGRDHADRERPGRLDARLAAGRPPQRDRHQVPGTGAHQHALRGLVPADERQHPAVQQQAARQAVNYAIDRNAAVRILGGPKLAVPACKLLPPGFPGHVDYCPYTKNPGTGKWTAPDLAKAKALVKQSGTAGQKVAVVSSDDEVNKSMAIYVQSVLNSIGYKATVKPLSSNISFTYMQNSKNKMQIGVTQWYQDYPQASDFLNVLLGCDSFHPGSDSSINMSGYCNKASTPR